VRQKALGILEPAVGLSTSIALSEHLDEWTWGVDPAGRMVCWVLPSGGSLFQLNLVHVAHQPRKGGGTPKTHAPNLVLVIRDLVNTEEVSGRESCLSSCG
jgi:hypothetical protein